jgi:hypothetical protein
MATTSVNGARQNGKLPRPSLAGQIDRLDTILDGLAEALNESVEAAVRDTVGQAVRDTVEAAVRDVLDDPQLVRAALARHAPVAALAPEQPPARPRPLAEALGRTIGWLCSLAGGRANDASKALGHGWAWALKNVQQAAGAVQGAASVAAASLPWVAGLAWRNPGTCAVALGVGAVLGVMAYCAGPVVASALVGLGGAAVSLGGSLLAAACRPFSGH